MITTSTNPGFSYLRRLTALMAMLVVSIALMLSAEKSMAQHNDVDQFFKHNPNAEQIIARFMETVIIYENRVISNDSLLYFMNMQKGQKMGMTVLSPAEGKRRFGEIGEKGVRLLWTISKEKEYDSGLDEIVVIGKKNSGTGLNDNRFSVKLYEYDLPERPELDHSTFVDGNKMPDGYLKQIEVRDIAEIKWLNPEIAIEKYGTDGSNGVQEVVLKRSEYAMAYINLAHMPQFPGGEAAWNTYVEKQMTYPARALESKTAGKVLVQCRVDVFGKLSHFKIIEDPGNGLGEEALRILKQSPDWIPGQQSGKWVHAKITVPIQFTLK